MVITPKCDLTFGKLTICAHFIFRELVGFDLLIQNTDNSVTSMEGHFDLLFAILWIYVCLKNLALKSCIINICDWILENRPFTHKN